MDVKPGYRSTEFWLSLLVTLLGAVAASGLLAEGSLWERLVGLAIAGLGALGYTAARASIKNTERSAAAAELVARSDPDPR